MIAPTAGASSRPGPAQQPSSIERIARNVGFLGVSQVLTWALALIYTLVVARLLGPAGIGALVIGWSIAGIAEGIAGLGSRPLIVKAIARDTSQGPALIGTAIVVRIGLLIPCAVGAYAYATLGHFSRQEELVILLGMGVALGFLTQEAIQGGLQGIERMEYLAVGDVINKSLLTFASIPLALMGLGPAWLMGVGVAVMAVGVVLNLVWIRQVGIDWRISFGRVRAFVIDSLNYWAFALFHTIYLWIDSAMLAVLGSSQEVGWYGVSTKLLQTLMFLPVILCTAWLPTLATAYKRGPRELKDVAQMPIELIGTLAMPIGVGTALIAGPLVLALYGSAFGPAQVVVVVLALTVIPTYLNIILSQVLIAADKQAAWTKTLVVASIANPALNLVLIPLFHDRFSNGALGAAFCMLITELLVVAMGAWIARRYLSARIGSRFLRAAMLTVIMGGAVALTGRFGVAIQIVTGVAVFSALSRPAGLLRGEELAELDRLARRIPFWSRLRQAL